jgi:hypothetical protein
VSFHPADRHGHVASPTASTDEIAIIERSVRCFALGCLSLIPVIGLGLAILAIREHFRVWSAQDNIWNPARRYLTLGLCLAWVGATVTLGVVALFVFALIRAYGY